MGSVSIAEPAHLIGRLPPLPRHGRRVGEPPHGGRSRQLGLGGRVNKMLIAMI